VGGWVPDPKIVGFATGFAMVRFTSLIRSILLLRVSTDGTTAITPFRKTLTVERMLTENSEETGDTCVHSF
jgi:hypothetical protein